jgi:hypothetical protein
MKDYKVYNHAKTEKVKQDLNPDNLLENLIMQRKTKCIQARLKLTLFRSLKIRAGIERVSVNELVNRFLMYYLFPETIELVEYQKRVPSRRLWEAERPGQPWPGADNVSKKGDVQIALPLEA